MKSTVILTIPGLRSSDVDRMPRLKQLMAHGSQLSLTTSFPAVTWPAQANLLTGKLPNEHGVVANGFYWRESQEVELWTACNEKFQTPQIWDILHEMDAPQTSMAWFPMLSKGSGADWICMPAPIHNPDGSESLWCYTKPVEFYGELLTSLEHFPLKHFWGPLANIKSTAWIAQSAGMAHAKFQPKCSYIYLPHLDYAAQKLGPDSDLALQAVIELDEVIGNLADSINASSEETIAWIALSEYVITEVDHVTYPNRLLRDAGLLRVKQLEDGEHLDFQQSDAWALVDHQFSHVFVKDSDPQLAKKVSDLFRGREGFEQVLVGPERAQLSMDHERSGDVILISPVNSWQAYYWWLDDTNAPGFAPTVDIHRKPGYDPVELHFDMQTMSTPLDATLIKGSHGAPVRDVTQRGTILCSDPDLLGDDGLRDVDLLGKLIGG